MIKGLRVNTKIVLTGTQTVVSGNLKSYTYSTLVARGTIILRRKLLRHRIDW